MTKDVFAVLKAILFIFGELWSQTQLVAITNPPLPVTLTPCKGLPFSGPLIPVCEMGLIRPAL